MLFEFKKRYLVFNLFDYSITMLDDVPDGGWSDDYKTQKLVMRYIEPGKFYMGSPEDELGRCNNEVLHEVILTRPFYIGIFALTQKQYQLITGSNPSYFKADNHPVESISYDDIRGNNKGSHWPEVNDVDGDSFLGILQSKTNLHFDLPTEAQWEYVCRAGTNTSFNDGSEITNINYCKNLNRLARYYYNCYKGNNIPHNVVGSYIPNAWGIYDMHGNIWEWNLDWYKNIINYDNQTDPCGPKSGQCRVLRGGCWFSSASVCRSAYRFDACYKPNFAFNFYGFRIVLMQ